jgi:hypothetical protein
MFLPRRRFGPPSVSYLPRGAELIHDFPRPAQGQSCRALLTVGSLRGSGYCTGRADAPGFWLQTAQVGAIARYGYRGVYAEVSTAFEMLRPSL